MTVLETQYLSEYLTESLAV